MTKKILTSLLSILLLIGLSAPAYAAYGGLEAMPTDVRMSSSSAVLEVGKTRQLSATVSPAGATSTLSWRSSDSSIASVDSSGLVTGVSRGSATIYATTINGLETYCQFTVRGSTVEVKKMEMSLSKMTLRQGQTRELWVLFTPIDTTEKNISWSSSDTGVAGVENNGTIIGVAPGTATITATAPSGVSATCVVTVPGKGVETSIDTGDEPPSTLGASGRLTSDSVISAVKQAAAITEKGKTGYADFKDKKTISATVMSAAALTASEAGRDIRLRFNTTDAEGKTLTSLTVNPQTAKERTADLATTVSTSSTKASSTAATFAKHFKNKVAVIDCAQAGSFGFQAQVSVKADLGGAKADKLYFYTYDSQKNTYEPLTVTGVSIAGDSLRFTTGSGGLIIVSDGALTAK